MLVGYARSSTVDQVASIEAQQRDLEAAGCERIFSEQVSSVDKTNREQLEQAIAFCREGDVFVCTKLDRLARSVPHLVEIQQRLEARGVSLRILGMDLDTGSAQGRLMVSILGSIAQFEREIMLERQREGIAKAKAEGKYKGRQPTAQAKAEEALALREAGVGASEIARRLGIGRSSVYRILAND
ncbi:MAG: recombinase family protein [Marichromatium sp.]|nr:recombinase family protein [Marichromatium sp.]